MTRQALFHKWCLYALALFPVWLLDAYILPRIPLWGITPMLLPLAAAAVAVLEGAYAGTGFGMAVGLLWELRQAGCDVPLDALSDEECAQALFKLLQ